MSNRYVKELYYIAHINNVPSILKKGILSHELVKECNVQTTSIYDENVIVNRSSIRTPDGRSLWKFANLYFQPRNPMLYRVLCEKSKEDIAVLAVQPQIINRQDIFISTGNAASFESAILPVPEGQKVIPEIRKQISRDWWNEEDGSKRKIMAECLVPDLVPPNYIHKIYVASHEAADKLKTTVPELNLPVTLASDMFFQPSQEIKLTPNLSLIEGDMFFSRMHTLTISVNCVGIMGKGLASTAKYYFPRVYVVYQELCRKRILKMGKPQLYKPESSFDSQLADEPATLTSANSQTWFLLFPTKRDWRDKADIDGIEQGLQWVEENYEKEGIRSLAIPALGCGLGRLEWREVGPLLCKYLVNLRIPVWIYLPADRRVPSEQVRKEFLLP